ncbi:MAG TPA: dihydropteroate synthase [Phycisphaerales bacterium]|nr:dihydropteroate synthase [Phycisphaerales bacterium]
MHPCPTTTWQLHAQRSLPLDAPRLLAIINATPDSFAHTSAPRPTDAIDAALRAIDEGADALDIGGESTRPGAHAVPADEETRRVLPVIHAVRALQGSRAHTPITIDTTKASVARAALDAGADAINDISAGTADPAMLPLAAARGVGIILMHRVATPQADSYSDRYAKPPLAGTVTAQVAAALAQRVHAAIEAGIPRERIVIDPGLGFGKTVEQNLELIRATPDLLRATNLPILSALSRKSFVGRTGLGRDSEPAERLPATLALSALHLSLGARLFRVHDVAAHRQALAAAWAILQPLPPTPTPPP